MAVLQNGTQMVYSCVEPSKISTPVSDITIRQMDRVLWLGTWGYIGHSLTQCRRLASEHIARVCSSSLRRKRKHVI